MIAYFGTYSDIYSLTVCLSRAHGGQEKAPGGGGRCVGRSLLMCGQESSVPVKLLLVVIDILKDSCHVLRESMK